MRLVTTTLAVLLAVACTEAPTTPFEAKLEMIGTSGLGQLAANDSDGLRLINVWATWCPPCIAEFPDLMEIQTEYAARGLELCTISADRPSALHRVVEFLEDQRAASRNFLYQGGELNELLDALDAEHAEVIPHTVLLAPGGEILFRRVGQIDPAEVRRILDSELATRRD